MPSVSNVIEQEIEFLKKEHKLYYVKLVFRWFAADMKANLFSFYLPRFFRAMRVLVPAVFMAAWNYARGKQIDNIFDKHEFYQVRIPK